MSKPFSVKVLRGTKADVVIKYDDLKYIFDRRNLPELSFGSMGICPTYEFLGDQYYLLIGGRRYHIEQADIIRRPMRRDYWGFPPPPEDELILTLYVQKAVLGKMRTEKWFKSQKKERVEVELL